MTAVDRCTSRADRGRPAGTPRVGPACRRRWGDDGASVVEFVITMPALLLAMMSIIQFALWQHAQHVALAAAQEGARVARQYDGSVPAAKARTDDYLDALGPTILAQRSVAVSRGAADASVTVTGKAVSVVPVFGLKVRERAGGPVERFVPDARGVADPGSP
jgi:Flp pilus assembly protein TadG